MREFAVSVLINLRDRLSRGLDGIRRRLEGLRNLAGRLGLDRLGGALRRVVTQIGVVGAAFATLATTAGGGLIMLGNRLAQRGTELEDLARRAGVATDALQELTFVGDRRGVNVDAIVDGLKELQLRADEFIVTGAGPSAEAFERLGLSADDLARGLEKPDALFEEIIDRLGQLDRAAQIRIADEVFGGSGGEQFVQLIDLGVDGIRELRREARDINWIVTPEQLRVMREYGNAVMDLRDRYTGLQNVLAEKLLPVLTPLVDRMSAWIDANRPAIIDAMESAVTALADAIPVAIDGFQRMIEIARPLAEGAGAVLDKLGGIETAAIALGALFAGKLVAALAAFGVALLTTPIGWFVLAVTGIALLAKTIIDNWDRIAAFFSDLWGRVTDAFDRAMAAIASAAEAVVDGLKVAFSWTPLGMIIANWEPITAYMDDLWGRATDSVREIIDDLVAWFQGLPGRIISAIGSINLGEIISWPEPPGWLKWMFGMDDAPTPRAAPGDDAAPAVERDQRGRPIQRSSLDAPALTGPRELASAAPASADAGLRPQRQEVGFTGELVVRVDGPGRVTSSQSSDPRVDIQPQRGPSLALA